MAASTKRRRTDPNRRILLKLYRNVATHIAAAQLYYTAATAHHAASRAEAAKLKTGIDDLKAHAADIITNTAAIDASVTALHAAVTNNTTEARNNTRRITRAIGHSNRMMNNIGNRIRDGFRDTASELSLLRGEIRSAMATAAAHPGSSAADRAVMEKKLEEIRKQQEDRWKSDDEFTARSREMEAYGKLWARHMRRDAAAKQWFKQYHQTLHQGAQNASQQNRLAGAVVGVEHAIIGLFASVARGAIWGWHKSQAAQFKNKYMEYQEGLKINPLKLGVSRRAFLQAYSPA